MRVLITGITGFVGRHLVNHLAEAGDVVIGLSQSGEWSPQWKAELSRLARLEKIDLADADSTETLTELIDRKQPEAIYHLAAQSNPQASMDDPRGSWVVNLGGTLNLLEAVRESSVNPRVLVVSSGVVYGNPAPENIPVREDCPPGQSIPIQPQKPVPICWPFNTIWVTGLIQSLPGHSITPALVNPRVMCWRIWPCRRLRLRRV